MILPNSIKVKNYKCFDAVEQGFESAYPLNIIIGKNNSGKSSLIDLIDYVIKPNAEFINTSRNNSNPEVIISDKISEKYIAPVFPTGISGGGVPGRSFYEYGMTFIDSKIKYTIDVKSKKKMITFFEKPLEHNIEQFKSSLENQIVSPFFGKKFKRISAERDIRPEKADLENLNVDPNGQGATNIIRTILQEVKRGNLLNNPDLIQKTLLDELNAITQPDIEFVNITTRDTGQGVWEIYFKDANAGLIAFSKMGSGIKTIFLVLLNLIIIPEIENISKENMVFAFEELENNLHPSLQRRLFNYIVNYQSQFKSYFFITTHSSIAIDHFGSNKNAQIIHVENNGVFATAKTVNTNFDNKNILKDLDYKASDLLLSNGIIWVEGPSDAIYLELLIDLYKKNIGDDFSRLNFTIQSLSTSIWKYAGFTDFNWELVNRDTRNRIISLEKLNHNHLIIIDGDGNYEDKPPSLYESFANGTGVNKASLIFESMKNSNHSEDILENNFGNSRDGRLLFWITDGTFETYLKYFILNNGRDFTKYFDSKEHRGYFEKKRDGSNSAISKVELAAEIAKFTLVNHFAFEDFAPADSPLCDKIKRLMETIKSWN